MTNKNFHIYLTSLGFSKMEISSSLYENIFSYSPNPNAPSVKYIHVSTEIDIFNYHKKLWNQNCDSAFIAVDEKKTYIIDLKKKPDSKSILKSSIYIKTFDYGVNSDGYKNIDIETISKNFIDSTFFYEFLQQKQRHKQEVDKDLLINLITLRNDLINYDNEQIIHLLILRSLFVKYLEDREIFPSNYLTNILESKSPKRIIEAFDEICKINGDVFGVNKLSENEIKTEYLDKLYLFFTTDYQSGQGTLFPYQFDNIPIQLISHVYEAFLKNDKKKGKGIYYTPSFVVNFMLSHSLKKIVKEQQHLTVLDPAVGSGAFLVESFKILRDALSQRYGRKLHFNEKKDILINQLWGIDNDSEALQITAFSLYLTLLEDESSEFIRHEIEHSNPILPSLIGSSLMNANTIIDSIFEDKKFDFIVSNPPWGSVSTELTKENIEERKAIDNANGEYPEYKNVSDYERSQAFLRRVARWQKDDTLTVMIVKNSIFLNDKAEDFRREFIDKNKIDTFFELSHYNKILFRKKVIGKIHGTEPVEIGASEPCVIVFYRPNRSNFDYNINYISPKLTKLGEHFELIQYSSNESFIIHKKEFLQNDNLWRILINGDSETYKLLQKIERKKDEKFVIISGRGFEPKKESKLFGTPIWRDLLDIDCFDRYVIKKLKKYNWNQEFRNKRDSIFETASIAIARRPLKSDGKRLRAVFINDNIVFKDNIVFAKLFFNSSVVENYSFYEILINSSLIGFYLTNVSSQWDKGDQKWAALRTKDIARLPFYYVTLTEACLTDLFILFKKNIEKKQTILQNQIDNIIFDLYELTDYEKEIIKEFYQVNDERANEKLQIAQPNDIKEYFNTFKETFSLILSPNYSINASFNISKNIGAIIKFSIEENILEEEIIPDDTLQVLQFVKNKQLTDTDKLLREEKIKIYEPTHFYLIKSNQFKDWTKRQAYKDAKEEIDLLLSNLPDRNE